MTARLATALTTMPSTSASGSHGECDDQARA
jgi:hypothetical protein